MSLQKILSRMKGRTPVKNETSPHSTSKDNNATGMVIGAPASWYTYGFPPRVDWYRIERVYRTFPLVPYAVEKFAEQATGPGFHVQGKNDQAVSLIEEYIDRWNLKLLLLRTAKELALYGNCFWELRFDEIGIDPDDPFHAKRLGKLVEVQILPVTTMRVVPEPFRGVKGYIQLIMGLYRKFAPEQIAHFKINVVGGMIGADFYGMGLVQPILSYIDNLQVAEDYMIRIMKRYAAPKIHWQLGTDQFPAKPEDLTKFTASIKTVKPEEDFVTSHTAKAEILEPDVRMRFEEIINHLKMLIVSGLQDPTLVLSTTDARVSDASANAMLEAQTRKVTAIQNTIKELVQDMIFKPLCEQEGFRAEDVPRLIWGEISTIDPKAERETLISLLDSSQTQINDQTRLDVENRLRRLLDLEPLPPETSSQQRSPVQGLLQNGGD